MTDKDKDQPNEEIRRSAHNEKDDSRVGDEVDRQLAEDAEALEQDRRDWVEQQGDKRYVPRGMGPWMAQIIKHPKARPDVVDDRWVVRSETWESRPSMSYIEEPTEELLTTHGCKDDWIKVAVEMAHGKVYPNPDGNRYGYSFIKGQRDPNLPTIKDGSVVVIIDSNPTDGHKGPWPQGKYRSEIVGVRVGQVVRLWDMRVTHEHCAAWIHIEQRYPNVQSVSVENLLDVPATKWNKETDTLRRIWGLLRNELSKGGRPEGSGENVTEEDMKDAWDQAKTQRYPQQVRHVDVAAILGFHEKFVQRWLRDHGHPQLDPSTWSTDDQQ